MTTFYDFLLHVLATLPPWVVAVFLGWGVSISVTQPLKFLFPLYFAATKRQRTTRAIAFGSAFGVVWYYLPTFTGFLVAVMVGVWSPTAYWLLMKVAEHRWPWLKDFLSGDVRGDEESRP